MIPLLTLFVAAWPIVDFTSTEPVDPARAAKNLAHDRQNFGTIHDSEYSELPMTGHWWQAIPPIPVSQSDLAVIGKVSSANAFLSANKSVVYSEFTIDVTAILKGRTEGHVIVERDGGFVRFPSGHVRPFSMRLNREAPDIGKTYVLFGRATTGGNYVLLTGYELREGRVRALDGQGNLAFNKFDGQSADEFLVAVRRAITAP